MVQITNRIFVALPPTPHPFHPLTDKQQDAIEAYEKTLRINPAHTTAMTSLARVYRAIGLNDKAEQMFKR